MATKKLTEREKKERAKIRKQLRAEGVLPPVKKRLNHERFIEGAKALLKAEKLYDLFPYICWAMIEMMGHGCGSPDKEAVGTAKVLLLAQRRKDFEAARKEQGLPSTSNVGELYEAVKDIYEA